MKGFRIVFRLVGVLAAILLGGIYLIIGVAVGLLLRPSWAAHAIGLLIAFGLTLLSWSHPDGFRFGQISLNLHGAITIGGAPPLLLNLGHNIGLALLGVVAATAARNAYDHARA
jgi:hypothetical protein